MFGLGFCGFSFLEVLCLRGRERPRYLVYKAEGDWSTYLHPRRRWSGLLGLFLGFQSLALTLRLKANLWGTVSSEDHCG